MNKTDYEIADDLRRQGDAMRDHYYDAARLLLGNSEQLKSGDTVTIWSPASKGCAANQG